MSATERGILNYALRNDLTTFIQRTFQTVAPAQPYLHNWHIEAIAWHLQQCSAGKIKRLVITVPPRSLKSISGSVAFVAWMLGRNPSARIVCASYSADLAGQNARQCRAVMKSEWYRRAFPQTRISPDKDAELNFETTHLGCRYSTSVGGTLTGRGGNILITDDALKAEEALSDASRSAVNDWYDGTLCSRLDDKRAGVIIIIQQRLHLDDLVGHVLRQEKWVHLNLPAIAEFDERIPTGPTTHYFRKAGDLLHEAREPREELEAQKVRLGSFRFSAQYQQRPVPQEGEIVKLEWFRLYDTVQWIQGDEIVQSWDTAFKAEELNDYSACTTWLVRGNEYYLVDILREKLNYPDLKRKVIRYARAKEADVVIIENKGSGMSLIDDLREGNITGVPMPIAFDPENDKLTRMATQSAKIEAGHVFLPRNALWLGDFQTELLQFPHGRHDDQVDSLSQFLAWIQKRSNEVSFSVDWGYPKPKESSARQVCAEPSTAVPMKPKIFFSVLRGGRMVSLPEAEYLKGLH
jgi:predicted phage terminase large subunit-like protein